MSGGTPFGARNSCVIGLPTTGQFPWQATLALLGLSHPLDFAHQTIVIPGWRVDDARNHIVHQAMHVYGADYVFFVDQDVVVPNHVLRRFHHIMRINPKISVIGGVYTTKIDPPEPMVFMENGTGPHWDFKIGEAFRCHAIAMGCTMIRLAHLREVEEQVDLYEMPTIGEAERRRWFWTYDMEDPDTGSRHYGSEDIYFCNLLQKVRPESEVWCDASILCPHIDMQTGRGWALPKEYNVGTIPEEVRASPLQAVDLGCGEARNLFSYEKDGKTSHVRPLRVDIRPEVNPDYRCDLRALPSDWTNRFDIVFMSHVLEHFNRDDGQHVLNEVVRICKPGGEIRIDQPNIDWAAKRLVGQGSRKREVLGGNLDTYAMWVLYGQQGYPENVHGWGYSPGSLVKEFQRRGCDSLKYTLRNLSAESDENGEDFGATFTLEAIKPMKEEASARTGAIEPEGAGGATSGPEQGVLDADGHREGIGDSPLGAVAAPGQDGQSDVVPERAKPRRTRRAVPVQE